MNPNSHSMGKRRRWRKQNVRLLNHNSRIKWTQLQLKQMHKSMAENWMSAVNDEARFYWQKRLHYKKNSQNYALSESNIFFELTGIMQNGFRGRYWNGCKQMSTLWLAIEKTVFFSFVPKEEFRTTVRVTGWVILEHGMHFERVDSTELQFWLRLNRRNVHLQTKRLVKQASEFK